MITNTIQPRASLHTLGCRLNQAETAVLGERLRQDGYRLVAFGEPTDLLRDERLDRGDDREQGEGAGVRDAAD